MPSLSSAATIAYQPPMVCDSLRGGKSQVAEGGSHARFSRATHTGLLLPVMSRITYVPAPVRGTCICNLGCRRLECVPPGSNMKVMWRTSGVVKRNSRCLARPLCPAACNLPPTYQRIE